jgi:hypothetical protein
VIRRFDVLCLAAVLAGLLPLAGCDKWRSYSEDAPHQEAEDQHFAEQKERAALVERMKAAAKAQDRKQEALRNLQTKIDAVDDQISDARRHGKDWRGLEKGQEALEAQKYELQRQ